MTSADNHWPHDQDGLFRCCGIEPPKPGDRVRLTIKDLWRPEIDLRYLRRPEGYDGKVLIVSDLLDTMYGPQFRLTDENGGALFLADVTELEVV